MDEEPAVKKARTELDLGATAATDGDVSMEESKPAEDSQAVALEEPKPSEELAEIAAVDAVGPEFSEGLAPCEEVVAVLDGEQEQDATPASPPLLQERVVFHIPETTPNVLMSTSGDLLKSFTDGGFQHLLAGARASVGIKCGRYLFEVRIVETFAPPRSQDWAPNPRNILRVGFSTAGSKLFLGTREDIVGFDSEGNFLSGGERTSILGVGKMRPDDIIGVLLNLDATSPLYNTISIFKDGRRLCAPQPLPESLKGKILYPSVAFRNVTVHVNFGPEPAAPLPFACHMIAAASQKDVNVTPAPAPKDGKHELLFPVGLPDEGPFEWLDLFLEKNPDYTEISSRAVLEWCQASGARRSKYTTSNDKPEFNFGIANLDDMSILQMLYRIAPIQRRNFVIMEVKGNLVKEDRASALQCFSYAPYKKVAAVVIGDPSPEIKKIAHDYLLKAKQEASDHEFRRAKILERQKKDLERAKRREEKEQKRKKALLQKKKAAIEEAKEAEKAAQEANGKTDDATVPEKEGEADGKTSDAAVVEKEGEERKDEEHNADPKNDDAQESLDKVEEDDNEDVEQEEEIVIDEEPPKVELTTEELKQNFIPQRVPDLTANVLSANLTKFSIPSPDEGFDEVRYEWSSGSKCHEYMKKWSLAKKLTTRLDELMPSTWFHEQVAKWQRSLQEWTQKQKAWKDEIAKNAAQARTQAYQAAQAAKDAAEAQKQEETKEEAKEEVAKEPQVKEEEEEDKKEKYEVKEMDVDEEPEEDELDFDDIDVFGVDDISNIGRQLPLYKEFKPEDWSMLVLRFELYLLINAFRRDTEDPDRQGIPLDHLSYYYNKYYKKPLVPIQYGAKDYTELLSLAHDSVFLNNDQVVETQLPAELETFSLFIKLTEEDRRYRQLRVDVGDDAFKLNVQASSYPTSQASDFREKGGGTIHNSKGDVGTWQQKSDKGFHKGDKGYHKGDDKGFYKGDKGDKSCFKGDSYKGDKGFHKSDPYKGDKGYHKGDVYKGDKGFGKDHDKGLPPEGDKGFFKGDVYKGDKGFHKADGYKGDKGFHKGDPYKGDKGYGKDAGKGCSKGFDKGYDHKGFDKGFDKGGCGDYGMKAGDFGKGCKDFGKDFGKKGCKDFGKDFGKGGKDFGKDYGKDFGKGGKDYFTSGKH